jgi:hypothetical protein
MMGSKVQELLIRNAKEKIERNLKMAERFSYHKIFEEKFLRQAIDAETELNALTTGE